MEKNKKLFLIAPTDREHTVNRTYTEAIRWIINNANTFKSNKYVVETHIQSDDEDLYEGLDIAMRNYEGYVILLDSPDDTKGMWNPNVMFEFGAVKNLNNPFIILDTSKHDPKDYPFDIANLNVNHVPQSLITFATKHANDDGEISQKISAWMSQNPDDTKEIWSFAETIYKRYIRSLEKHEQEKQNEQSIHNKLDEILESVNVLASTAGQATAIYIDGEAEAFKALALAVKEAKTSLRTSRFANESIVVQPTPEQKQFMDELYQVSARLNGQFIRIICNNHPSKWQDIYSILIKGGNGSRVYVRKSDFSIHFELVVIDNEVAFVHFYQADNGSQRGGEVKVVEKLNSTLKIQGSSIGKRFTNIFDRLHHRDFEANYPHDPSRTLLGIPLNVQIAEDESTYDRVGFFELPAKTPDHRKGIVALNAFKKAFMNWEMDNQDRINMAVGIALIEGNEEYIDAMHEADRLDEESFLKAKKSFNELNHND